MLDVVLFNMHDSILLTTVYQCVLFSILVFFIRPQMRTSNMLLVGFLLSTAAIPIDTLINYGAGVNAWMSSNHPNWFYVFEVGYWVQGPFLLWYVRSVIYKNFKLDRWDLIYLIPFLLYFTHQLASYHLLPTEAKALIQQRGPIAIESESIFYIMLARESLRVFFGITCVLEVRKFRKQISNRQTASDSHDFAWLSILAYGFLGLWICSLVVSIVILFSAITGIATGVGNLGLIANYITCIILGVFIVFVSSRSSVFSQAETISRKSAAQGKVVNLKHINELERMMVNDKPYLEHHLTLDSLAEKIGLTPRVLSQTINRHYGYNFFEFINHYRIKEAKQMLLSGEHHNTTVLDIMYNCGFNSKATFNNFFKKVEGLTPREYKKQNANAVQKVNTKHRTYELAKTDMENGSSGEHKHSNILPIGSRSAQPVVRHQDQAS